MTQLHLERTSGDDALAKAEPRFRFYTDLELAALPPLPPAIEGMLFLDTLAAIVAKWDSYKTFIALEMAFCMAFGADYYGRRAKHGAVIYLSAEGGAGLAGRVGALRAKYGGLTDVLPLILHPGAVDISNPSAVADAMALADRKLQDIGFAYLDIVAVFVDTVARNMRGDENKVEDMNAFIRGCDAIRHQTGACVVGVHHTGWNEERGRGSTALPAAVDTEIMLARDGDRVTVKCTKQKDEARFVEYALEAFPMAGSLVFQAVAPTSPKLTANEHCALSEVQHAPGLRSNEWMKAAELPDGSYNNARRRLIALDYVVRDGQRYVATDAGRLALSARCNTGANGVQS